MSKRTTIGPRRAATMAARRWASATRKRMGRRMAEGAALLVDHVLPAVGYRQWVLSFPGPMAVRLGYDAPLLAAVAGRLARAVMQDMRRRVKQQHGLASVATLHAGVVTARAALPQRPRPLCTPALPGHRRRVRGAGQRAALPAGRTADAGAHDRRARAGPRGHPRRRRRPRHRPRAGRLRAALARWPTPRARLPARSAAGASVLSSLSTADNKEASSTTQRGTRRSSSRSSART